MKSKIIEAFQQLEESELTFLYSMAVSAHRLMNSADSLPNPMKASLSNACGQMTADDGTEYQVKITLVADKTDWMDTKIVEVLSPVNKDLNLRDLNINDIN